LHCIAKKLTNHSKAAMSNPKPAGRIRPRWGSCRAQFRFTL